MSQELTHLVAESQAKLVTSVSEVVYQGVYYLSSSYYNKKKTSVAKHECLMGHDMKSLITSSRQHKKHLVLHKHFPAATLKSFINLIASKAVLFIRFHHKVIMILAIISDVIG